MIKRLNQWPSHRFLRLLFVLISLSFLLCAPALPDRASLFSGLWHIMTSTCQVTTNTFHLGGYAASFFNAGLVGLICTGIYFLPGAKPDATSLIAFLLTVGFAFWGVNPLNISLGFYGVLLFCLVKKEAPGTQANAMLFTTGLCPLYSDLLFRYPHGQAVGFHWGGLLLALGTALLVGFVLPAGLRHSPNIHKGFDLFSAAMPVGMLAFFLRALFYEVLGGQLPLGGESSLAVCSKGICNLFCIIAFGLCIGVSLVMGCRWRDYKKLLADSGLSVDFAQRYGNSTFLMNMGVYGVFILLYYNLIGAPFNSVTFGCIFCMLSCCNADSHPKNVWPIMLGYLLASLVFSFLSLGGYSQQINAQSIVVGLCFASGLSPISGKYGWQYGLLAAVLHFVLVTSVPLLHGGFCLYNGGLTAALVCILLIPVLEQLCRPKTKV